MSRWAGIRCTVTVIAKLFKALDAAVIARNPGWQVMAQLSLGEFLASPDKEAYGAVNAKRVDFALMDPQSRVTHAIEGTDHHQGIAAARDAVKKEALRKAGIGYHEVVAGHTTAGELRRLVERLVPGDRWCVFYWGIAGESPLSRTKMRYHKCLTLSLPPHFILRYSQTRRL